MNGRVYDPLLARFMSADPTIPVVEDGQSLNRFSYVFNNPLSYTDPSGFTPEGEKEPVATPRPCTTKDCKDNDKKKRCLQDNDCWNGGWRSFYPEGGVSTFNGGTKAAASKGQATAADSAKGEPSQSDALTPGELLLQRIADKAALARNCSLVETGCAQAAERVYKAIEKRQALESFDKEIIEAAFFEFKAASLVLAIPLKRLAAKGIPGIDKPFRAANALHPPNAAVVENMNGLRICSGTDCSEIASALRATAGEGRILRVTGQGGSDLRLMEYGKIDGGFKYHEVFTDGRYIYDPRLSASAVPLGDWTRMIQGLNPGAVIK